MIKSMTGFGRCEYEVDNRKYTVEMKGVNHRYLDFNIRMPKKFNFFDSSIRTLVKKSVARGKVDMFITYEDNNEEQVSLKYNNALAKEYMDKFKEIQTEFSLDNDIRVSTISRCPEVLTMEEQSIDEEELWKNLKKAVEGALEQFASTRETEGDNLRKDLIDKLNSMVGKVEVIDERSPEIIEEFKNKILGKVKELLEDSQIEDARITQEVVMFSEKICTDEETVRLKSHISHMKDTLMSDEPGIGRKLDFIAQEMNREANTILSKANDISISNVAIDLKTEVEKIREQIQNIE
ncbi:MAG: YicC/YloC family endoribonuclease [Suipraeoptans sp.]